MKEIVFYIFLDNHQNIPNQISYTSFQEKWKIHESLLGVEKWEFVTWLGNVI